MGGVKQFSHKYFIVHEVCLWDQGYKVGASYFTDRNVVMLLQTI